MGKVHEKNVGLLPWLPFCKMFILHAVECTDTWIIEGTFPSIEFTLNIFKQVMVCFFSRNLHSMKIKYASAFYESFKKG